jgi:hypothetical protein
MKPTTTATMPEATKTKHARETTEAKPTPRANEKKPAKPFAHDEGDKQVVNGIGDTADEENERHSTPELNENSRTRE